MKIIYILPTLEIRGSSIIYEQVDRLGERGHEVVLTSLDETKNIKSYPFKTIPTKLEDARKEFEKADVIVGYKPVTAFFINDLDVEARKYCLLLDDEKQFYSKDYFEAVNRTLSGTELEIEYEKQRKFLNASYKLPLKYIVPNDTLKKKIKKSILAPIGVNLDLFYPEQFVPKQNVIRLITNDGTFPWENAEIVNRALTKLRSFELWTIGSGKPNLKTDKHWAKPDALTLRRVFSSSDIFINMQTVDGTAESLLQAMACGCAVITARNDGMKMFCKDGKNCIIVKGRTDEDKAEYLKNTIQELTDDKEKLETLIQGGLETIKDLKWNIDNLEKGLAK